MTAIAQLLVNIRLLCIMLQEQYEFALSAVAQEVHSLLSPSIVHR